MEFNIREQLSLLTIAKYPQYLPPINIFSCGNFVRNSVVCKYYSHHEIDFLSHIYISSK